MSDSEDVVSPADSAAQKLDECTDPRLYVLSSTLQTAVKNLEDNLNNTLTSQLHCIESGLDKRFTDLFSKYDSLVSTREDHNVIPSITGNPVEEPLMLQHRGATSDENGDPRVTHDEDIVRTPEDLPADNEDEISLYTSEAEETLNSLLGHLTREPSPESEPPVTDESLHEQLKKYYEEFENNEPLGNPINEKLADFVNHTWHNRLTTDSMKNRLNKVLVPGNIDNDNSQVNKEIFQMPGSSMSRVRSNDIELQSIVKTLVKAMCPIIYHADKCYEANSTKPATQISNSETIGACMDTLFLVQHAINQIDDYRREKYKPELPGVLKKLSKEPQGKSTLLFGDNLEVRIKEIKDASAMEQELVTEKFKKRKSRETRQTILRTKLSKMQILPGLPTGIVPNMIRLTTIKPIKLEVATTSPHLNVQSLVARIIRNIIPGKRMTLQTIIIVGQKTSAAPLEAPAGGSDHV